MRSFTRTVETTPNARKITLRPSTAGALPVHCTFTDRDLNDLIVASRAGDFIARPFRQLHSDFEAAGRLSSRRVAPRDARGACAGAAVVAGGGRPWASSDSVWALAEARNEQRSVVFFAPSRRFVTGVARGTRSRNARRTRAAEPRAGCARGGSRPWSASNRSSDDFSSAIGSRAGNANDLDAAHAGVFDEILCFSLVPAFE